jgi:hypothetical protein
MLTNLLVKFVGAGAIAVTALAASAGMAATASARVLTDIGTSATPAPTATVTPANDPEHWPAWIQGRPKSLDDGSTAGWYFWHDDSGLHIATTTPSDKDHVFSAVLTSAGTFRDIDKIRLEGADDIKLLDGGHRLVVKFHTHDGIDGVNFHLDGGDQMKLRFDEAGRLVGPSRIFVGAFSVHPGADPFVVHR